MAGIIYVLRKEVAWREVPSEVVGCSGVTAWRRLRDWTEADVCPRLHEALLTELPAAGSLDMDDACDRRLPHQALNGGLMSGIKPLITRRGVVHGSGLGRTRWVVERTFAWLHQFKRLRIRYQLRADLHRGLLELAYSIICLCRLPRSIILKRSVINRRPAITS
ncbi:transposase [Streptomyces albogriseolus]|uniref:transposase n=1 Tax=Streptomyces albogriseolus TaxID=1887 RepID=UPI003F53F53C